MRNHINNDNTNLEFISVIVPIYNAEEYLSATLNSIVNQTYKNLEIILINDGSIDNSSVICNYYKQKDNRIILINQNNSGVGIARNVGLAKATGKYVTFVDSDDILDLNLLENLYNSIVKYDADIVEGGIKVIFEKDSIIPYSIGEEIVVLDKEQMLKKYLSFELSNAVWGKLYKRDLIKKIKFPATNINEDFIFLWQALMNSSIFCHDIRTNYNHYFINSNSLINTNFGKDSMLLMRYADSVINDIQSYFPNLIEEAVSHYNAALLHNLLICLNTLEKGQLDFSYLDDIKFMIEKAKSVKFMDKYFISLEEGVDIKNVAAQIDNLIKNRGGV